MKEVELLQGTETLCEDSINELTPSNQRLKEELNK